MNLRSKNILVIAILILLISIYNGFIYSQSGVGDVKEMSTSAMRGELIWQKNNCAACHQIYGLGGYLGPDLTNIASHPNKGEGYIKAMMSGGTGAMPNFQLSENDKSMLYAFLMHVDLTGYYPIQAEFNSLGWGELKYK